MNTPGKKISFPNSVFGSRSGQVLAVIPIVSALAIGGLLMWNYNQSMQESAQGNKAKTEAERIAKIAMKRVERILRVPTGIDPDDPPECGDLLATFNAFRDVRNPNPPSWDRATTPASIAALWALGTAAPNWLGCILPGETLALVTNLNTSPISTLELSVARIGVPDLLNLSMNFDLTVIVTSYGGGSGFAVNALRTNEATSVVSLKQTVRLQAASMGRYSLILAPLTILGPHITVSGGSKLKIAGSTYVARAHNAIALSTATALNDLVDLGAPADSITLMSSVDFQARQLSYNATDLNMSAFNNIFRGGIRSKVFAYVERLPIFDGVLNLNEDFGGNGAEHVEAWDQQIKYFFGGGNYYPRASLATQLNASHGGMNTPTATSHDPVTHASVAAESYGGLYGGTEDASPSVPLGVNPVTCPNRTWVYSNPNGALTLDTNNAFSSPARELCGFIRAREVSFNLQIGQIFRFYGQIIAQKITVQGGGTLIITQPADGLDINGTTNMSLIFKNQQEASLGVLHNFFVPVLRNVSTQLARDSATFPGYDRYLAYRPHGAVVPGTVGAPSPNWDSSWNVAYAQPASRNPKVGYMIGCYQNPALGVFPGAHFFCPKTSLDAHTLTDRENDLDANGRALVNELVYE